MTEYGVFIVPNGEDPDLTVEQVVAAERAGLAYVGVQDHPYQRRYLDTWTLFRMSRRARSGSSSSRTS